MQPKTATSEDDALLDASATCSLTAEQTEGPYYFDVDAIRRDLREGRPGTRLNLTLRVRDAAECVPLENAVVDLWHCDALGVYSGFESASQGPGGGGPTDEETYLRGAQVTDANGIARFVTVYPGWYPGRTVHIHAKVHLDRTTVLTTQLYFADAFSEQIHAREPYREHAGRSTRNGDDGIYDARNELTLREAGDAVHGAMTFDVRRA